MEECGTDHKLVCGKLKMYIKRKVRATGVKLPKRTDVSKFKNSEVRQAVRNTFDNIDVGGPWEQFKTHLYTVAVDVLGIERRKTKTDLLKMMLQSPNS